MLWRVGVIIMMVSAITASQHWVGGGGH